MLLRCDVDGVKLQVVLGYSASVVNGLMEGAPDVQAVEIRQIVPSDSRTQKFLYVWHKERLLKTARKVAAARGIEPSRNTKRTYKNFYLSMEEKEDSEPYANNSFVSFALAYILYAILAACGVLKSTSAGTVSSAWAAANVSGLSLVVMLLSIALHAWYRGELKQLWKYEEDYTKDWVAESKSKMEGVLVDVGDEDSKAS